MPAAFSVNGWRVPCERPAGRCSAEHGRGAWRRSEERWRRGMDRGRGVGEGCFAAAQKGVIVGNGAEGVAGLNDFLY